MFEVDCSMCESKRLAGFECQCRLPGGENHKDPDAGCRVWAIEYEQRDVKATPKDPGRHFDIKWVTHTVTVSADSEYGAIKRLCGNRLAIVKRVMLLDIEPEYAQRRIEGYIYRRIDDFTWPEDWPSWEYT